MVLPLVKHLLALHWKRFKGSEEERVFWKRSYRKVSQKRKMSSTFAFLLNSQRSDFSGRESRSPRISLTLSSPFKGALLGFTQHRCDARSDVRLRTIECRHLRCRRRYMGRASRRRVRASFSTGGFLLLVDSRARFVSLVSVLPVPPRGSIFEFHAICEEGIERSRKESKGETGAKNLGALYIIRGKKCSIPCFSYFPISFSLVCL